MSREVSDLITASKEEVDSIEDVLLDEPKFKKRKKSDGAMEDEQILCENIACTYREY